MQWVYEIYWKDDKWQIDWNNKLWRIQNTLLWEAKKYILSEFMYSNLNYRSYWYTNIPSLLGWWQYNPSVLLLYIWSDWSTATEWDSNNWSYTLWWWLPVKSNAWSSSWYQTSTSCTLWTDIYWDYALIIFNIPIWNEWSYNELWILNNTQNVTNFFSINISRWVWSFTIPNWWAYVTYKLYYNDLLSSDNVIMQWFWLTDFSDWNWWSGGISNWFLWINWLLKWSVYNLWATWSWDYYVFNRFNKIQIWTWNSALSKNDTTLKTLYSSVDTIYNLVNVRWNWTWADWLTNATKIITAYKHTWIFTNLPTWTTFTELWLWSDRSWTELTFMRKLVNIEMTTTTNKLQIDFIPNIL